MSQAVELIEQAYFLVTRYEETRDAVLLADNERCVEWLVAANLFLAAHRELTTRQGQSERMQEYPLSDEELAEARAWRRANFPGIEDGE